MHRFAVVALLAALAGCYGWAAKAVGRPPPRAALVEVLQRRRSAGEPAGRHRCGSRRGPEARAAAPLRQSPVHGDGTRLRPGDVAAAVQRARHRELVRTQVPRPEDLDRRGLRHVRDDRRASDAAAAVVCARDQRRDRPQRGRARQRPRTFPACSRDRPLVRGGAPPRHRATRQRRGPRRGDPARRRRRGGGAAASARRRGADGRPRPSRSPLPDPRAASSCSSVPLPILPMRRLFSRTCRTRRPVPQSNRACGRSATCGASSSDRTRAATRRRRRPIGWRTHSGCPTVRPHD